MRSERTEKLRPTAFDLIAAALAPALIIGMIGSLVFFLVIAFYRGDYDVRLMYILGLFTLATVLIARIAIASGRAHANAFAVPLAVVALIAMFRFVTIPSGLEGVGWLLNVGLLALVWFLADRITFDCTLLEEERESVQGGLLQTLGVPLRTGHDDSTSVKSAPVVRAKKRAKHNPGVWVLYFAVLAFPLFGLGQLAIPDPAQRSRAFWMLVTYLGCALALLTTTSLLALRRYLRQRGVEMPEEITVRWLTTGLGLAVGVLLVCMVLPLPGRNLGLIGLPFEITSSKNLTSSRLGMGNDGQQSKPLGTPRNDPAGGQEKDGQATGGQDKSGEEKGGQQKSGQAENGQPGNGQSKQGQPGSDGPKSDQGQPAGEAQQRLPDEPPAQDRQSPERSAAENRQAGDRTPPQPDRDPAKQPPRDTTEKQPPAGQAQAGQAPQRSAEPEQQQQQQQQQQQSAETSTGSGRPFALAERFSQVGSWLGQWFKWLTIVALVAIVVLYALTHPGEVARLWRGLFGLLAMLFGGKRSVAGQTDPVAAAGSASRRARPPFTAFANPFAKNLRGWQAAQVVEHTFAALEAWSAEHGRARQAEQTAEEFAKRLAADVPQLGKLPTAAAAMLDRIMFAGWQPTVDELAPLAELWRRLESLPFLSADNSASAATAP